jgi:hypothetical protein
MEKREIIQLFALINQAYDMFEVTEEKVNFWYEMLADQDPQNVLMNLREHISKQKFPPSIAELRGIPNYAANSGYLAKDEHLRIEERKKEALKYIPEDCVPDFIKQRRAARNDSN